MPRGASVAHRGVLRQLLRAAGGPAYGRGGAELTCEHLGGGQSRPSPAPRPCDAWDGCHHTVEGREWLGQDPHAYDTQYVGRTGATVLVTLPT